jgi:hypothetical protein
MTNEKPIRIQRSRKKVWRMPGNTVYVGRPTKWGNPFKVGESWFVPSGEQFGLVTPSSIGQCVSLYREYAEECMKNPQSWMIKDIHELRGKNLACFCPLDKPCHADVLLELANTTP